MAGFQADGALAAMSRRAHDILGGRGLAAAGPTSLVSPPAPPQPQSAAPTALLQQLRANQQPRMAAMANAMRTNLQSRLGALGVNPFQAPSRASVQQMAQLAARKQQVDKGGLDQNPRYTDEAMRKIIQSRTPGGQVAHQVMHEGEVTVVNGHRGVFVKYWTPQGMDTRWTPID